MDICGVLIEALIVAVAGGMWGGAVGDFVADSDLTESFRARLFAYYHQVKGDVNYHHPLKEWALKTLSYGLDCRFCVSFWACIPGVLLAMGTQLTNGYGPVCALALTWGMAWKFSTILRGISE